MPVLFLTLSALLVASIALYRAVRDRVMMRQALKELSAKIEFAQKALRRQGDLANEIAHEIKNPLTAILCSAETLDLLLGPKIAAEHRKSLQYIREYGDHLLHLVGDFLDVSRLEAGKLKSAPERVSVGKALESVVGLLHSMAIKKNINLIYFAPNGELDAWVDPQHFKQLTFNIIHNALKFTDQGGSVNVVVEEDFPRPYLKISIRDNGCGIPEEQLERVFDIYARYESVQNRTELGAGLGLALCKSLVELATGKIEVESKEGVGTCFRIFLPLAQSDQPQVVEQQESIFDSRSEELLRPLTGQSFLIVDENAGAREAISKLIEAWGGVADRVDEATKALEALGQKTYDAVMIDDDLACAKGAQFLSLVKGDLRCNNTTLIVAAKGPEAVELAKGMGADRCVEKPLNGDLLLKSLINSGRFQITH